ncbi:MAG: hypothetical protein RDV41_00590 [Planctomycetota bacterium]|nr:hypothetical protein [Planctomycetota bacterium]
MRPDSNQRIRIPALALVLAQAALVVSCSSATVASVREGSADRRRQLQLPSRNCAARSNAVLGALPAHGADALPTPSVVEANGENAGEPLAAALSRQVLEGEIESLIAELGSPEWRRREAASARLREIGRRALPYLGPNLAHEDPEVACRARTIWRSLRSRIEWTGAKNDDWHNPENWEPLDVPDVESDVAIGARDTCSRWPRIWAGDVTVERLFIAKDADVRVMNGTILVCRDRLIVGGRIDTLDGTVVAPRQCWAGTTVRGDLWVGADSTQGGIAGPGNCAAFAIVSVTEDAE